MDLDKIANNIDRVINDLPEYAVEILARDYEGEVIEIQQGQMSEGVRGDGKKTGKYKSQRYVAKNKQTSKSLPNKDYKLEGDFYKGMFVADKDSDLFIGSFDEKTRFLEPQEDNELFGIAKKNIKKVDNIKGFAKKLIKKTGHELSR